MNLSIDLIKVLKMDCDLLALDIQEKILFFIEVILSTIKNEDYQREILIHHNLIFISGENEDS